MNNKPNILILGATGKVGGEVVNQLTDVEHINVIAATRSPEKAQAFEDKGISSVILDLDKPETIAPALENCDRALLLTGYTVDMLRQSKRFLDTAKQQGIKHIVHIGASTAPTNKVAHWGWHQFVEAYIEKLNFSYTHLRPEAFMQNLFGFGWLNNGVITNYIGNARWSWIDCYDLAAVVAQTLLHPEKYSGQTIPLGYDAKTMDEVAQVLTEIVGQPFTTEAHPPKEFLNNVLQEGVAGIYPNAYLNCVYTQFELNQADAIPEADRTFNNFEPITGSKPNTWKDFAINYREQLAY
ncbi:SDR family oxidoreductase [Lusitaniella coriacea LEGE 07157]|uniref:SDR family oxidoreductase n=1 Tax=Lusitaniella coriacea LEGE 07157 TaxID=945747 RepID=A0A8J7DVF2_9CYAN|nr:SDR family oxidoreductase [Lusitaniella coriacea]MBE9115760.1 SDR family oxidoreductase [Lusitaniella coriacea LEGE 07157]